MFHLRWGGGRGGGGGGGGELLKGFVPCLHKLTAIAGTNRLKLLLAMVGEGC